MPDYSFVVPIVIFLVVAVIAFKIIKGIVKTVITLTAILAIVLGIGTFLVYSDASDLKENFGSEKNLFVLVDDTEVISAIEFHGEEDPEIINQQDAEHISELLEDENFDEIQEDYYKVILFDSSLADQEQLEKLRDTPYTEEKARIFVPVVEDVLSDPLTLVSEYKQGNISIHEESPVFKAIKIIPTGFIKSVAKNFVEKAKNVVVDRIE
jgi:hypothetical protein